MSRSASLHACTIATRSQLPSVRVLCQSLRAHHPDAEITVLVLDAIDGAGDEGDTPDFRLVAPADLGLPSDLFAHLAMACTAPGLAEVLTPALVGTLVEQGAPAVVFVDAETEVFAPLTDVIELAVEHGVVLAPRVDAPLPDDGLEPTPTQLRTPGALASELVAVGGAAARFVDWWGDRQLAAAFDPGGPDASGPWTSLVPAVFPVHVLRDPGCGVSAWNLHTRELRATTDGYEVSGRALRWFHFDGYSPAVPHVLSTHFDRPRVRLSDRPSLARLCDEHGERLRTAGYDDSPPAYRYDALPDGREIDARMRRMYVDARRDAGERGEAEPPSAFGAGGADAFVQWVDEPVEPPTDPRVSRYLARVWHEHEPIRQMFPSLAGEGAEQYVGWIRTSGRFDEDIPEWLVPSEAHVLELIKRRWRARPAGPRPQGVNVIGYVTAVVGVGEVARLLASTLEHAGVPKSVVANRDTASAQNLGFDTRFASDVPYDVNLLCVNADQTTHLAQQLGPEFFAGRRSIGVWFWEVEEFPPSMTEAFELVDEVWVASDFVLEAIAPVSPRPVRKFPLAVPVPSPPTGVTRSQLELPEDRFVFLFAYDFLSTAERKNPVGLIDAYTRAFGPDDGTVLVVKSINGDKRVAQLERVRKAAAGRSDVIVLDAYLPQDRHNALLGACDAYVSLHRSEGFGLDLAGAMGLGKPVLATGYSGNLEFMDDSTGYLVDYELETIGPGCEPYPPDSRWARPDPDHAAELMRRVVEHPDEARERGRRAAARIRADFSLGASGDGLARMVDEARARPARGPWRQFFMEGWRARRPRVEDLPYGALDWLPDGAPVDPTMRHLLVEEGAAPDPELDLTGFYGWLNEPVFPPKSPVVSRYLHRLWCDRPDLQSHFPDLIADLRAYLAFLVDYGHDDTDIPYELLPTHDDVRRANRYQTWRARRAKLTRAFRSAGQRAAGVVNRR